MNLVALFGLALLGHAAQPYAPSPDRPSLVGLRIDPAPGRTEISIVVDGAPPIRVREPLILDDRARIEIEIPGAAIRVNRPIYIGPPTGGLLALRATPGAGGARVLVDLPVGRRYDVRTAPNGILFTIENHDAPATLWITGVRGYGSPPRIVRAAMAARPAPAAPGRAAAVEDGGADATAPAAAQVATAPAATPAATGAPDRVGEAANTEAADAAASNTATADAAPANAATASSTTANAVTAPTPRPARPARAAAERPALAFAPPTAAQALLLLALLALPSVLLALLRRRGRAAAPADPVPAETGAPKPRTRRRLRAPRAARRPGAEPGALWAARTLARTDTPAVEVARRTGLSQDAVLLLRRAAGARAEEAAGSGRNVRAAAPARGD